MCPYCQSACVRHGKSITGNQRYRCKSCRKTFSFQYSYAACRYGVNSDVKNFVRESVGVRSIARLLSVSATTVLRKIRYIAASIIKPMLPVGKSYEIDELCTYVKKKTNQRWVAYAIRKDTGEVVDFTVGCRTNNTLKRITDTVLLSQPVKIYTDKLSNYASLIPYAIHSTKKYGTNHIERKNLSLRTHLKRLSRKSICFSKSTAILIACLKIYFWG